MPSLPRLLTGLIAVCLVLPTSRAAAQGEFRTGSRLLQVGMLFGGGTNDGPRRSCAGCGDGGTGFGVGFEVGAAQLAPRVHVGLGASVGFLDDSNRSYDVTWIPVLFNANLHFTPSAVRELDLYTGFAVGVVRTTVDGVGDDFSDTDTAIGLNLGARYFFTNSVGGTLQLGFGDIPAITLGLAFRL